MNFNKFKDWFFLLIISGLLSGAVWMLSLINGNLLELNTKIAVVISRQEYFDKRLEAHEFRILKLEQVK